MQSDIVQRLQNMQRDYAGMRVGAIVREAAAEIARLTEALRAAEERENGLREKWGELHNTCNIAGSPYAEAMEAVDRMVAHVRTVARAALKGPSHDS